MQTEMSFDANGFVLIESVVPHSVSERLEFSAVAADGAGSRTLLSGPLCQDLATRIRSDVRVAALLPPDPVAVQCTLFDKSPGKNWLVTLHQDLSIPVRDRVQSRHCTGWSQKEGQWFVQPPVHILEQLTAVRVHLDASTAENGPLRVVPGSHLHGRLTSSQADSMRQSVGELPVLAARGDVIAMRPLVLHASSKASLPMARRVLHFLFGSRQLPHGLAWAIAV
jgi:hypothetical protein